jgi:hypothetical protein
VKERKPTVDLKGFKNLSGLVGKNAGRGLALVDLTKMVSFRGTFYPSSTLNFAL